MAQKTTAAVQQSSSPAKAPAAPKSTPTPQITPTPAASLQALHDTLGNQAVQRLFKSGRIQAKSYSTFSISRQPTISVMPSLQRKEIDKNKDEEDSKKKLFLQRFPSSVADQINIQASMQVSSPGEPAEKEADATAKKIMRMAVPESSTTSATSGVGLFRQVKKEEEKILRRGKGQSNTSPSVAAAIRNDISSGTPLPAGVRGFMEPRFKADFGNVRIHTGENSAGLNRQLQAHAFTVGSNIFFGKDKFKPETPEGKELIAHELTHTIQQGAVIQRSEDASINQSSPPMVQRLGLSDILDSLADLAANVPGYTLLTVIIGRNPINMRVVERNFTNLLRGFMGLIPGGEILFQVLNHYGVVERLGNWVNQQVTAMGITFQSIRNAFTQFTDSLGIRDIFSPGAVWERAKNIFTPTITRIKNFVSALISQAITWLKETFMQPLSSFCRQIPGYGLVTVLLGRDPFTNIPVPRTALNVVRAFAEFIPGGTEKVDQLVQSGALQKAYDWFTQETQARNLTWARVTGTFSQAWNSLQLEDVLHPIDTLQRIGSIFSPLMRDLVSFAGSALMKLLELIFEAVMGAGGARVLTILKRVRDTFTIIIRNPVGFLGNLLSAVGLGVRQFMNNILRHLQDGVIAWLTGPVARAGIQMPDKWDLRGIIWFVLQILGLTWTRIRQKLVNLMGERAVAMLESGFQLIQDIREKGLVQALKDRVTEFFGQLRDAALGSIRTFIQQRLVMAGITQLLSMLNPVGAIIQAIIKTYTTIQFFIQRINQILDLVESIVNSIAAIAAGNIASAANFIERTMARTIPVILDFLARFIGLGDVSGHVQRTIQGLQARVDQMLDQAVDWIKNMAQRLASRALGGDPNAPPQQRLENGLREGTQAVNRLSGNRVGIALIRPVLTAIKLRNNMRSLEAQPRGTRWAVVGEVNPRGEQLTEKLVETGTGSGNFHSLITYESINNLGFGVHMIADPVGPDHPQGTPVSQTLRLELREDRGSRQGLGSIANRQGKYRLGHLLNHHLGGPGNDWRNLTPITPSANTSHLYAVEDRIKTLVNNQQNPRWVKYEVKANYTGSAATPGPNVHSLETQFARRLQWSYQLKKPNDDANQLVDDNNSVGTIPARDSGTVESISVGYPT